MSKTSSKRPPRTATSKTPAQAQSSGKTTKAMIAIEERMAQLAPGSYRYLVLSSALDFKHAWVELGAQLTKVVEQGVYREWGFDDFETYCRKELHLKAATAHKLTATYGFMQRREPALLREAEARPEARVKLPEFDLLRVLTQAEDRGQLGDQEYQELRGEVFQGMPPTPARLNKIIKERWPAPPPPPLAPIKRIQKLARAASKLAEAAATIPELPEDLLVQLEGLADRLEILVTEKAA